MKQLILQVISFIIFLSIQPIMAQSSIKIEYQNAFSMLNVLEAIHNRSERDSIENLLDKVLATKTYQVCEEQYITSNKQINLTQFKKFIMSFTTDSVNTLGNRRLIQLEKLFADAINNPEKYRKALNAIDGISNEQLLSALETAANWLPNQIDLDVEVLILFDIGGGAWAYKSNEGKLYSAFSILLILDEKGELDTNLFLLTLAHELHHLGIPLNKYFASIGYETLPPLSPLKLYSEFFASMIKEGFAQKFCSNAPGKFTGKPYPAREYSAIEKGKLTWQYFTGEFDEIHKHAINDLEKIVAGGISETNKFEKDYINYWTWHAGMKEKKEFVLGRRYFYGCELLGVINKGLGREALFEIIYDFRKLPSLFNKAFKNLYPELYLQYKFPEELVNRIEKL